MRQGKCFYHPVKPASYICGSCSKSICSVCARNISGVFFCPQCAPSESPMERPSTTTAPPDNTSWYRALFSIGLIFLIIGVLLALAYWPLASMSAAEFENLVDDYNAEGGHNFEDYRDGDTITIKDSIARITIEHDPSYGVITRLWFESTGEGDLDLIMEFDADLERDYHVGDTVFITLHVGEDTRTRDEIIKEQYNTLPDISNIDHTVSVDIVFYSLIVFGAFLILLYVIFTKKVKNDTAKDSSLPLAKNIEEGS